MIRLNDRELSILRCLAVAPRTQDSFTFGPDPLSANAVRAYLKTLVEAEFIALPPRRDCGYPVTQEGLDHLARLRAETTPSRIWGNASTTVPYEPPVWNVRAGADQHRQYASRGLG
jgi:hypothetical protein